jgi:acyl carrier protein
MESLQTLASIKSRVRDFVIENFRYGDASGVTDDLSLVSSGVVDSTGVLEVITFLEDTFAIKIADPEVVPENLDSVDTIAAFVERKLERR